MSTQPIPYFGRAWQVSIQTQASGRFSISSAVGKGEEALKAVRADGLLDLYAEVFRYSGPDGGHSPEVEAVVASVSGSSTGGYLIDLARAIAQSPREEKT